MSTSGGDGHGRDGMAVEKSIVLPRQAPPRRTTTSKLITTSSVQLFLTVVAAVALLPAGSLGSSLVLNSKNCLVQEPLYNITFNLTTLDSDLVHHIKSDIGETFTFDVCDHLKRPCNGVSGGAACLLRQDKSEVLLARESTLQLIDGRLHFNFSGGDACRNGKNYSLDIILMCSYSPEPEPMSVVPYSDDQCNYFIFWRTKHACAPLPERVRANECAVRDASGHVFNLLPLSQLNHRVPDRNGSHFSVTACKPVHYGHMTMCPIGSSVCHVNDSESDYTKKYHDYGQTDANPTIEEGKLIMNLASAEDKCQNSKIFFECDEAATDFGPEYLGKEGCTHLFTWRTSLACKKREFCAVVDPNSGFVFNMSSLAGKQIKLVEANRTYELAICKTADTQCPGSCEVSSTNSQTVSLGNINADLQYNITGAPYLRYESGAVCNQSSNARWSTKIEFICETDKGQTTPPPKVVENTGCELIVQLETELACLRNISCSAMNLSNDRELDLTPLISSQRNYLADINDTLTAVKNKQQKFFLNVCRPLLSEFGLGCRGGSAACVAEQRPSDKTPTNELSLGYPDASLVVVGDRAHLKYLRGDHCPQDNATDLSTEIEFYCAPKAGHGNPILQEILHDCHYRFEWPTNVICPGVVAEFRSKTCEIFNAETGATIALLKIFPSGELQVSPSKGSVSEELKRGKIQLCDKNLTALVDYKEQALKVHFTAKDPSCEGTGGNINVNLHVACAASENFEVNEQTPCHLVVTQLSPQICDLVGATAASDGTGSSTEKPGTPPPTKGTSSTTTPDPKDHGGDSKQPAVTDATPAQGSSGGRVGVILAVLTLVSLAGAGGFLLLRNPERREYLRSLFRGRNVLVQYSRVRTNEEASLLMHPPGALSDSDDEMLI
uniref:Cation-independent mannose-6-phosphate receptor n=1 Tax=Culex pipiens TaxID=7175 RepID=A0A8D8IFW6_CULPI